MLLETLAGERIHQKDKAALPVSIAALRDGRMVVLAIEPGHRQSTAS